MHTAHSQGGSSKAGTSAVLTVDVDALFAELAATAQAEGAPNVWTTTELMDRLCLGRVAVKKRVGAAINAGKARAAWKQVRDMHGELRRVQAYEFCG